MLRLDISKESQRVLSDPGNPACNKNDDQVGAFFTASDTQSPKIVFGLKTRTRNLSAYRSLGSNQQRCETNNLSIIRPLDSNLRSNPPRRTMRNGLLKKKLSVMPIVSSIKMFKMKLRGVLLSMVFALLLREAAASSKPVFQEGAYVLFKLDNSEWTRALVTDRHDDGSYRVADLETYKAYNNMPPERLMIEYKNGELVDVKLEQDGVVQGWARAQVISRNERDIKYVVQFVKSDSGLAQQHKLIGLQTPVGPEDLRMPQMTTARRLAAEERRLAEDAAVDTFTVSCVWVISLLVISAVVLLDRYAAKAKRDAMQRGQTSWEIPSLF